MSRLSVVSGVDSALIYTWFAGSCGTATPLCDVISCDVDICVILY